MSFNDADTFSFDKLADPEVLGVMNGGTIWDAPPMNPSANSNTAAQVMGMPIQAELTQLCASDTTDGVYEESGDDLDEISQSPLLESRDTAANLRKSVDDLEQHHHLAKILTETTTHIPQRLYQPRGATEREKYVNTAKLSSPIMFYAEKPSELGIALEDILQKNSRRLSDRDDFVFEGGSRSISLRIEWPGYRPWNCQLLTKNYRKTPGPITKEKLAKNLATCIRRFIQKTHRGNMEADPVPNPMWRISADGVKFEDIILVSLNHVSQGSWQPQLRLRRRAQGRA
ncbi:hypothetical protein CY34DRAFT_733266 [Suillus luteus UH-Slu-Lm8-n1]|uniref:Uncharacterized protein n=1 Tax=Suillus luteus UH-Slu-Lm8-n1 TaxID=930992 RepID=A0A0D0BZH0_9AGAM|nr:hypothetical protein CY34DRAFT_733266 [Suillus luteus UH-Slu-Lm8-n1]